MDPKLPARLDLPKGVVDQPLECRDMAGGETGGDIGRGHVYQPHGGRFVQCHVLLLDHSLDLGHSLKDWHSAGAALLGAGLELSAGCSADDVVSSATAVYHRKVYEC